MSELGSNVAGDNIDELYKSLLSEDNITRTRKAKEAELGSLTTDQYNYARLKCKNDVMWLAGLLGYNKLSPNLHGHLSRWMMKNRDWRFRLLLLPRSHFKTTIWTIADSIRLALPGVGNNIYPEDLGTNIRILIGHEVERQASMFLYSIASHFLGSPWLTGLFPECVPSPRLHRINKVELELPRTERWSEATYTAMGVGGRSQGFHWNILKLDDLIGDKARDSKTEMEAAKVWFDNIESFFIEAEKDHLDLAGTRWAIDDLYKHVMNKYGVELLRYIRPAEEWNAESKSFEPIFPEQFSMKTFARYKKNPIVWNAQYANNPEIYGRILQPEWKRFYEWLPRRRVVIFNGSSKEVIDTADMDRCILVDPAMEGLAGIVVTGNTAKHVFTLETIKASIPPDQFIEVIFALVLKWRPRVVKIEKVLFSGIYKPWLQREMRIRNIFFHIEDYSTNNKAKPVRVRGLVPYFSNNAIYFHQDQVEINEEYDNFGATENYHLLDALAQGPETWSSKPFTQQNLKDIQEVERMMLGQRDSMTGY